MSRLPRFNTTMNSYFRHCSRCWLLSSLRYSSSSSYYQVLGIKQDASLAEIKEAYYRLSKKYHPDVAENASSGSGFYLEIKDAYEVLKDEKKRQEYDIGLSRYGSHYGRSTYAADGPSQTNYDSEQDLNNFYARTPQYENEKFYADMRRNEGNIREMRQWMRQNASETNSIFTRTCLLFISTFFVCSMILRIRMEHLRRKAFVEDMSKRKRRRKRDVEEQYHDMLRNAEEASIRGTRR